MPRRDEAMDTTAHMMRFLRKQAARRLRALRAAAQQGNPTAQERLRHVLKQGPAVPNPDRRSSCLKFAALASESKARLLRSLADSALY